MGCASSTAAENVASGPGPKNAAATAPSAPARSQQDAASRPAAGALESKQQPSVQACRPGTNEDISELDQLLRGTKSQIQARPLELAPDSPQAGERISASRAQQQAQQQQSQSHQHYQGDIDPAPDPHVPQQPQQPQQPPDPWASLQSAYRIDSGGAASPDAHDRRSRTSDHHHSHSSWSRQNQRQQHARSAVPTQGGSGHLVVLDEHGNELKTPRNGPGQPLYARQPPAQVVSVKPKQGGWGQGQMAQAGTLMVGEEETIAALAPPQRPGLGGPPPGAAHAPGAVSLEGDAEFEALRQKRAAQQAQADLGVEDIEDIDELIRQEDERGVLSEGLAAKLAKFEALADDDD